MVGLNFLRQEIALRAQDPSNETDAAADECDHVPDGRGHGGDAREPMAGGRCRSVREPPPVIMWVNRAAPGQELINRAIRTMPEQLGTVCTLLSHTFLEVPNGR